MNTSLRVAIALVVALADLSVAQPAVDLPVQLVTQITSDHYAEPAKLTTLQSIPRWKHFKVTLNKEGLTAYIIREEDPQFCGSGGCGMLIYADLNGNFRSLYDGGEFFGEYTPRVTQTNGLYDLECKYVARDGTFFFHTLWFDGKQYQSANPGANHP